MTIAALFQLSVDQVERRKRMLTLVGMIFAALC